MSLRAPLVRHFIACQSVDQSLKSADRHYALHGLVHRIRLKPGALFPHIHPALSFYVMLSDGSGACEFGVDMVYWSRGNETSLWQSKRARLDLGSDPLTVHGWPIKLNNLLLPRAGEYHFILQCDGNEIAREILQVEGPP